MTRQLLGPKKVAKLREATRLPIVAVSVRGGCNHEKRLCLDDGRVIVLHRNGEMTESMFRHTTMPA